MTFATRKDTSASAGVIALQCRVASSPCRYTALPEYQEDRINPGEMASTWLPAVTMGLRLFSPYPLRRAEGSVPMG